MPDLSVFDIIGPVMIGPSSSHTAGAARLGQIARCLFNQKPDHVTIYLHGSFGSIYKGHCTDKALVGGLLGLASDNKKLINAFRLAKKEKLDYIIKVKDLGLGFHPNTVRFMMKNHKKQLQVTGSSLGGGNVLITNINGFDVSFSGEYSVLIIEHKCTPDFSKKLMQVLINGQHEIVIMHTSKPNYNNKTLTIVEMTDDIPDILKTNINLIKEVKWVRSFNHKSNFDYT